MFSKQMPNGKFKFTEWYIEYRTGKRRRVTVTMDKDTAASKREAQRILNQKIEAINFSSAPEKITLAAARDAYTAFQERTLKQSTAGRCKARIGVLTRLLGEDTRLESLTAGYVNKKFLESGRKKSTLNEDLIRFKAWIRWCYQNDLIEDIRFLDKLKPYKVDKPPEKLKYMEREELQKILPYFTIPINRMVVEFLALSGCRVGEALALEWTDIDDGQIHITKTYDHINKVTTSTKTESSCRDIFIQPELAELIRRLRLYYMETGIRSDLVFANWQGEHLGLAALEKYFRDRCEKVLGRRLTLHSLRHTHASLLFEQGMSLEAVSARLGHSDSRITKDIYLHITENKQKEYDSQLKKILLLS